MVTLLLLVLYVCGTSHLELLHSFVHKHEVGVAHSDEQEKDPCHRLIYHNDTEQGCGHDSHLVVSDKCEMCDLVYHGDHAFLSNIEFEPENFPNKFFSLFKENLDSYWAVISSSRAPPTFI
jgi:hypothetical protein